MGTFTYFGCDPEEYIHILMFSSFLFANSYDRLLFIVMLYGLILELVLWIWKTEIFRELRVPCIVVFFILITSLWDWGRMAEWGFEPTSPLFYSWYYPLSGTDFRTGMQRHEHCGQFAVVDWKGRKWLWHPPGRSTIHLSSVTR